MFGVKDLKPIVFPTLDEIEDAKQFTPKERLEDPRRTELFKLIKMTDEPF